MDHALRMCVGECLGHVLCNLNGVVYWKLVLTVQLLPERLALHKRHHIEQERVRFPGIEERQDVRVLEVGGCLDLGQEAVRTDHCGQLRLEHLERDLAFMAQVVREEDGRHPAFADLAVDLVATFERRVQPVDHVRHVSSACEGLRPMGVLGQVPTWVGGGARKV